MSSHIHRLRTFLACAGFLGLAGCGDNPGPGAGEPPDMPDAAPAPLDAAPAPPDAAPPPRYSVPDPAECRTSGSMSNGGDVDISTIYYNALGTNSIMFNALTSNPEMRQALIEHKLHSETYDSEAHAQTAPPELMDQLTDVWTRRLFSYLVACALSPGQSVSWHSPVTGESYTWTGERGFCPQWYEGGVADDQTCQELVSACLLASNNVYERQVRISMRGVKDDEAFPWNEDARGGLPNDVVSGRSCTADDAEQGAQRDCGWQVEHVGVCREGAKVEMAGGSCEGDTMVRICPGHNACDAADSLPASADMCEGGKASFDCPETGQFTVMSTPASPKPPGKLGLQFPGVLYPVKEDTLFSFREGAFYGNLFAPDSLDERLAVRVKGGQVVYSFALNGADPIEQGIYDVGCDYHGDMAALRRERHEAFVQQVSVMLQRDFVVHRKLFACWDPGWSEGAAYAAERVCAGPRGAAFCAARPLRQCWDALGSANNLCDTDDGGATGDRDYSGCRDDQNKDKRWEHPVTVFLDDPCAVVSDPGLCAVREVKTVVAGFDHTCALLGDGKVRCWGDNFYGQLGYGHRNNIGNDETPAAAGDVPVTVDGRTATQIVAGHNHTCALLDTEDVRCWGRNDFGQLGYGHTNHIGDDETLATLVDVPLGGNVKQITAGGNHNCVLLDTGAVRCWGWNAFGRLGYGHTNDIGDDETLATLEDVPLGVPATQIAAGGGHTCALLDTGAVRCWGANQGGQLGYGHTNNIGDNETLATLEDVPLGVPATQIAAGGGHTCVLLDTGAVRCWGGNDRGQLGYGHTNNIGDDETLATLVDVPLGVPVKQITAGWLHTCVLLESDDFRCWGYNWTGQLGYGNTLDIGIAPDSLPADARNINLGRMVNHSSEGWLPTIVAGAYHTCAITGPAAVRCWGRNDYGNLGYGNNPYSRYEQNIGDDESPALMGDVPVF